MPAFPGATINFQSVPIAVSSRQKWPFTYGRKKSETFYSEEALAWQKQFLDHFLLRVLLRGVNNEIDQLPKVRLEVRKAFYEQEVRSEDRWPPPSVEPAVLYLCANTDSCNENRSLPKAKCNIGLGVVTGKQSSRAGLNARSS